MNYFKNLLILGIILLTGVLYANMYIEPSLANKEGVCEVIDNYSESYSCNMVLVDWQSCTSSGSVGMCRKNVGNFESQLQANCGDDYTITIL